MPRSLELACITRLGVLQHEAVKFKPELPAWKKLGIETFAMVGVSRHRLSKMLSSMFI